MRNIKKFDTFFESETKVVNKVEKTDEDNTKQTFIDSLSIISELSKVFVELFKMDLIDQDCNLTKGNKFDDVNEVVDMYFEDASDIKTQYNKLVETMKFITDVESVNEGLFDKFTGKSPVTEEQIMQYINKHKGRRLAYNSFDDIQKKAYVQFFKENPSLVNKDEIALVKWDDKLEKFVKGGTTTTTGNLS